MILFVPASSSPVFIRRFSAVSEDALPYYSEKPEISISGGDRVESKSQQLTSRTRSESWRLAQTVQQLQTSYILAYSLYHLIEGELWGKRWKNSKKLTLLKERPAPWVHLLMIIPKADSEIRLWKADWAIIRGRYPIPKAHEHLQSTNGSMLFIKLEKWSIGANRTVKVLPDFAQ